MAARAAVVTLLSWALLTFTLVWYWTGYYGGVAAHHYFWCWILTWFFTEIIPLPFGSVPYRGARYTIPSMYPFLCYKYYSGGSFPGWFWHYAPWGFLITAIIFVAIGLILFRPERDHTDDRYVRGTDVVPQRRLRHKLHGNGVELGGMLRQIEVRGETAVVLDPECEYLPRVLPARARRSNPEPARCALP